MSGTVGVTLRNVSGAPQTCGIASDSPLVSPSAPMVSLAAGASTTVSLTLSGGRELGSGDYSGDVTLTCGAETLKLPWWTRVDRRGKP